jgi:hypothetical protein
LKGVRYKFYKLLVRIKFIRFIFSHIYKWLKKDIVLY